MNKYYLRLMMGLSMILLLGSCGTLYSSKQANQPKLETFKTAYIVKHSKSTRGIENHIQKVLTDKGVLVSVGSMEQRPGNVDFYVEFTDNWTWWYGMYMNSLTVSFKNTRNGSLISTGYFIEKKMHFNFFSPGSDPFDVVQELIDDMYLQY